MANLQGGPQEGGSILGISGLHKGLGVPVEQAEEGTSRGCRKRSPGVMGAGQEENCGRGSHQSSQVGVGDFGGPVGLSLCGATFLAGQPPSSFLPASCLHPLSPPPPPKEVRRADSRAKFIEGPWAKALQALPRLGKVSRGSGRLEAWARGGGLGAQAEGPGEQEPLPGTGSSLCLPGGHASPLSTCFGAPRRPLSGATGTRW